MTGEVVVTARPYAQAGGVAGCVYELAYVVETTGRLEAVAVAGHGDRFTVLEHGRRHAIRAIGAVEVAHREREPIERLLDVGRAAGCRRVVVVARVELRALQVAALVFDQAQ